MKIKTQEGQKRKLKFEYYERLFIEDCLEASKRENKINLKNIKLTLTVLEKIIKNSKQIYINIKITINI